LAPPNKQARAAVRLSRSPGLARIYVEGRRLLAVFGVLPVLHFIKHNSAEEDWYSDFQPTTR
jgi:hypothetical protein